MAEARKLLPEEKLNELLAQGLSAKEISKRYSLPLWAIYELKKQYGKSKPDRKTDMEAEKKNVTETDAFTWAVPIRTDENKKTINISKEHVRLSMAAARLIDAQYIKIGVSEDGILALVPTTDKFK